MKNFVKTITVSLFILFSISAKAERDYSNFDAFCVGEFKSWEQTIAICKTIESLKKFRKVCPMAKPKAQCEIEEEAMYQNLKNMVMQYIAIIENRDLIREQMAK